MWSKFYYKMSTRLSAFQEYKHLNFANVNHFEKIAKNILVVSHSQVFVQVVFVSCLTLVIFNFVGVMIEYHVINSIIKSLLEQGLIHTGLVEWTPNSFSVMQELASRSDFNHKNLRSIVLSVYKTGPDFKLIAMGTADPLSAAEILPTLGTRSHNFISFSYFYTHLLMMGVGAAIALLHCKAM